METMELKLDHPFTKEQWELLTDENLEHSDTMWFDTPNGNHFEYKKVRHGKWKQKAWVDEEMEVHEDVLVTKCSECGMTIYWLKGEKLWDFCPHCGAKMINNKETTNVR